MEKATETQTVQEERWPLDNDLWKRGVEWLNPFLEVHIFQGLIPRLDRRSFPEEPRSVGMDGTTTAFSIISDIVLDTFRVNRGSPGCPAFIIQGYCPEPIPWDIPIVQMTWLKKLDRMMLNKTESYTVIIQEYKDRRAKGLSFDVCRLLCHNRWPRKR